MDLNIVILTLAIILSLVGILGTILPFLPGVAMVFAVIVFYGWWEGFEKITFGYLLILGLLTLLSVVLNYLSSVLGAKYFGSTKAGIIGALIGTAAGIIFFPPAGIILGPVLGGFLGEYIAQNDTRASMKAGIGAAIGVFSGIAFQFALALGFFVSFLFKVF